MWFRGSSWIHLRELDGGSRPIYIMHNMYLMDRIVLARLGFGIFFFFFFFNLVRFQSFLYEPQ